MKKIRLIGLLCLLLLTATFVFQNWETVSIRFLFWSLELPRLVLVSLLLLVGFAAGVLATIGRGRGN